MKKLALTFFSIVCLILLCSCHVDVTPFRTQNFEAKTSREFDVYVCGAVKKEGYVHISEGTSYQDLIDLAGYIPQTVFTQMPEAVVNVDVSVVILRYFDGTKQFDCVNVNGGLVTDRVPIENVSPYVTDKIADYIEQNGKITDKTLLEQILGDDYADNYYKFFVSESDYEKVG